MRQQPSAIPSGTCDIGGGLRVHRLGFGAMRVTGPGIWGEPADPDEARRVLHLDENVAAAGVRLGDDDATALDAAGAAAWAATNRRQA